MCRVCFAETASGAEFCRAHDGKRPSPRITYVWRPSNPGPAIRLRGERCVIEGTGGDQAYVRFIGGGRLTVRLDDLEREAV